jgi:hypothetical protein
MSTENDSNDTKTGLQPVFELVRGQGGIGVAYVRMADTMGNLRLVRLGDITEVVVDTGRDATLVYYGPKGQDYFVYRRAFANTISNVLGVGNLVTEEQLKAGDRTATILRCQKRACTHGEGGGLAEFLEMITARQQNGDDDEDDDTDKENPETATTTEVAPAAVCEAYKEVEIVFEDGKKAEEA